LPLKSIALRRNKKAGRPVDYLGPLNPVVPDSNGGPGVGLCLLEQC
jgi:hypothetical protein